MNVGLAGRTVGCTRIGARVMRAENEEGVTPLQTVVGIGLRKTDETQDCLKRQRIGGNEANQPPPLPPPDALKP